MSEETQAANDEIEYAKAQGGVPGLRQEVMRLRRALELTAQRIEAPLDGDTPEAQAAYARSLRSRA